MSSLTGLTPTPRHNAMQYVATVSEPAAAIEGHPFIVEAGVSLGGQAVKDGINVYRFANRIPLLFEAGNDVVTQVRKKGLCTLDSEMG